MKIEIPNPPIYNNDSSCNKYLIARFLIFWKFNLDTSVSINSSKFSASCHAEGCVAKVSRLKLVHSLQAVSRKFIVSPTISQTDTDFHLALLNEANSSS